MVSERENGKRGTRRQSFEKTAERTRGEENLKFSKGHTVSSPPLLLYVILELRASFICCLITSGVWHVKNLPSHQSRSFSSGEEKLGLEQRLEYANSDGNNSTPGLSVQALSATPLRNVGGTRGAVKIDQEGGGGGRSALKRDEELGNSANALLASASFPMVFLQPPSKVVFQKIPPLVNLI